MLDPLFLEIGRDNFHISDYSPCINAGTPDTIGLNIPEFDLDNNPRIYDDIIDLGAYEWNPTISNSDEVIDNICNFQLLNNPNPFNPETTISYSIPDNSNVELSIYNIKGQKVRTLVKDSIERGNHSIIWKGKNDSENSVSSGVYFYKLDVNGKTKSVKKCLMLK